MKQRSCEEVSWFITLEIDHTHSSFVGRLENSSFHSMRYGGAGDTRGVALVMNRHFFWCTSKYFSATGVFN